jgi:hypothetical protein
MTRKATSPEHHEAIKAVAGAEQAARKGNGPKALELLESCGRWVLKLAIEIGVEVAVEAIKSVADL